MSVNSWPENDSYNELESLDAILTDLAGFSESDDDVVAVTGPPIGDLPGRRRKAAIVLVMVWGGTFGLHMVSWGSWAVLALTALAGVHALRILVTRPFRLASEACTQDGEFAIAQAEDSPGFSLLVAAKNEEAVIQNLVEGLCCLDYPDYELWIIDDNSTDQTPVMLRQLAQQYPQLNVFHRPTGAGGGKSGALNQVLPLTRGEIVGVFDADAKVTPDLLKQVLPLFQRTTVGAVQVRKEIANPDENGWTRGQAAEFALDTYIQQQRIAVGGIGELRGNGQFVRRKALEHCGGWNEETITDDLDLTLRLHLDDWDIEFLPFPAVSEEGVTSAFSLWHQRNRWAEGGHQRYLDYWRLLLSRRLGPRKSFDMFMFWLFQYILPTAAVPDSLLAIVRHRTPVLAPMTTLTIGLFLIGMYSGLRRIQKRSPLTTCLQTLYGTVYMLHWLVVMASVTARMSVRPKRLKWVKTIHQGLQVRAITTDG
jgi:1,2-diacylglycerol 3-beta-glucosyltransferase